MNDKIKIVLGVVIIGIIIIFIINIFNKDEDQIEKSVEQKTEIQYNNETEEYYVTDETGRIIHTADTEEELYIYTIDPEYNPKTPVSDVAENNINTILQLQ